jgi:hypothetical protein
MLYKPLLLKFLITPAADPSGLVPVLGKKNPPWIPERAGEAWGLFVGDASYKGIAKQRKWQ